MTRWLGSVMLLLVCPQFLIAQAVSGGDCDLSVRVRTSSEQGIQSPIQVQVLSANGVIARAQIVGADPAQFRVQSGKTYRLSVSGSSIEAVTTPFFEINPLEPIHTETVVVKLADQKPGSQSTHAAPTISVSEMEIPKKAKTEMNAGLNAYSKANMESAAAHFEKAIAEYPSYARAYEMLGVIAIKAGNHVKARELFSKAIAVDGTFSPTYVDMARLDLEGQDYAAAESWLTKAIALNPSMPASMALLASAEFANKEYDKALSDVERTHALWNHEPYAEVHIMAGKVLILRNQPEAAIAQFELFLKEKPDGAEAGSVRTMLAALKAGQQH